MKKLTNKQKRLRDFKKLRKLEDKFEDVSYQIDQLEWEGNALISKISKLKKRLGVKDEYCEMDSNLG